VKVGEKALNYASRAAKLPLAYAAGLPKIEITGCDLMKVEGHRGLMEYGGELITIRGAGANIRLRGARLQLEMMNETELIIRGDIFALEFVY